MPVFYSLFRHYCISVVTQFHDNLDNTLFLFLSDDEPPVVVECSGPNSTIFSSDSQAYVDWTTPTFTDNSGLAVNVSSDQSPGYFRIGRLHSSL